MRFLKFWILFEDQVRNFLPEWDQVATMDFCGRFIVASALTEPVIVGHIRASIRVPQCLELAQRRPMMYPRTPAQPTPAQLTPFPPGLWGGWAGVGPRLYDTSVLRLQLRNVCDLCFTACILRLQNILSMDSTRYISRMLKVTVEVWTMIPISIDVMCYWKFLLLGVIRMRLIVGIAVTPLGSVSLLGLQIRTEFIDNRIQLYLGRRSDSDSRNCASGGVTDVSAF